jgi:hypothetical protein
MNTYLNMHRIIVGTQAGSKWEVGSEEQARLADHPKLLFAFAMLTNYGMVILKSVIFFAVRY